jgi:MraZ protein
VNKEANSIERDELFFFGEYEHSLDSQARVSIPSEWRRQHGDTRLILFPGGDRDLLLFPFESFSDFLSKARKVSFANRRIQEALARIGSRAQDCRCDKQGRIKLSRKLLEATGIDGQVMLVGAFTHIKLCSPTVWTAKQEPDDVYLDELQKINEGGDELTSMLRSLLGKE